MGMDISVACPKSFEPDKNFVQLARNYSKVTKSKITIGTEPKSAVKGANIIYNDTFVSMGDEKERKKRLRIFLPKYQVNSKLLKYAEPDVLYMHCLPAHRNEEVTPDVIDGPRSIVFDQAENRLHTQKALLTLMVGKTIM
jgi:ornithine carbamoyltransferase